MNEAELRIKKFSDEWQGCGHEKSDAQKFWLALLREVLNVAEPEKLITFEKTVKIDEQTKYIDGYIACTKILIEQKSLGVDLDKGAFEQGKSYADNLTYSEKPRRIITCNFDEFRIYDLVEMRSLEYLLGMKIYEPMTFKLSELRYFYPRLKFIVDPNVTDVKPEIKLAYDAAEIVKTIYEAFEKNFCRENVKSDKTFLDKLCTRLVFCFYASFAQIIDDNRFFNYLKTFTDDNQRLEALQKIFDVLDTPDNERDNFDDALKNFPHINGRLFAEKISFPERRRFRGDPVESIFPANNPDKLNWRKIDPPIFGAMFESILNDDTRRAGGMHYTSTENIHKVIDPLFLDDLHEEFIAAKNKRLKNRPRALLGLQDKLAAIKIFDPACGSGNFLTESYISLRRIENEILKELRGLNVPLPPDPVKVSINQFYGIEIHDFAVAVAQVALYIAENQMLQETEGDLGINLDAFPLKHYAKIIHGNALEIDWQAVVPNVDYIIGNPPFHGARNKTAAQASDIKRVFDGQANVGNLDYVTCWFKKAADFMKGNSVRAAFISTNSVCQGDSVGSLWKNLFAAGIHIDFAHRTFKWLSDSDNPAHVHCIVTGFSTAPNSKPKKIFDGNKFTIAENINAYLVDGEDIFVESRNTPLQDGVPEIGIGNKPIDGGNYLFTTEERDDFIKREPASEKYFKTWFGAEEFIKGKRRYCLLLRDLSEADIKKMPLCWERVEAVRNYRLLSKSAGTRKIADKPTRFHVENFPQGNYILIPRHSAGTRSYVPIGFMSSEIICGDANLIVQNAEIYHFGILTSSIHNIWAKITCGYLGTSYRYSKDVVYNNFPWCSVTERRRRMIERTAQEILEVRSSFGDWTLAKLYDESTMPDELRHAHKSNDYAVALAYGFEKFLEDEAKIVAVLMKMYKSLTDSSTPAPDTNLSASRKNRPSVDGTVRDCNNCRHRSD